MKYILWVFLLFSFVSCIGQDIDWQKTSDWKMYKVNDDGGLGFSVDSLRRLPFVQIKGDSILNFIKQAEIWPKEKTSIWMGAYYVTCQLDGSIRKIDISVYGGFFYEELTHRYYQIPDYLRNGWMSWLVSLKRRVNEKQ